MPARELRAVFLDLDDTLTEYPGGFGAVLESVYRRAVSAGAPADGFDRFRRAYWNSTCGLWAAMHAGTISGRQARLVRMRRGLEAVSVSDDALTQRLSHHWDDLALNSPDLRPGADDLLGWLRGRVFLGLITDGYADLQRRKLKRLGLEERFDRVQISEEVGTSKPFARTFRLSLEAAGVAPVEAVMVGDNANSDVRGALGVGMQAVHLQPGGPVNTPAGATWAGDLADVRRLLEEALG